MLGPREALLRIRAIVKVAQAIDVLATLRGLLSEIEALTTEAIGTGTLQAKVTRAVRS